jgi:hypothetical protein
LPRAKLAPILASGRGCGIGEPRSSSAYRGRRYILDAESNFYGVWDKRSPGPPIARFDPTPDGWQAAWNYYSALENGERKAPATTSAILLAIVVVVVALGGIAAVNPRLDIPVISKVVCSVKGGTWSDGSVALGIPAGCYKVGSTTGSSGG